MTNELETYIASLKPGDKFWVDTSEYGRVSGYQETVDRITPTGRIVGQVDKFSPNGRRVGDGVWDCHLIALPTFGEKIAAYNRRQNVTHWRPAQVPVTEANIDRIEAAQKAYDATIKGIEG